MARATARSPEEERIRGPKSACDARAPLRSSIVPWLSLPFLRHDVLVSPVSADYWPTVRCTAKPALTAAVISCPESLAAHICGSSRLISLIHEAGRAPATYLQESICFFQAEDGIRDYKVTGVQTCALPI